MKCYNEKIVQLDSKIDEIKSTLRAALEERDRLDAKIVRIRAMLRVAVKEKKNLIRLPELSAEQKNRRQEFSELDIIQSLALDLAIFDKDSDSAVSDTEYVKELEQLLENSSDSDWEHRPVSPPKPSSDEEHDIQNQNDTEYVKELEHLLENSSDSDWEHEDSPISPPTLTSDGEHDQQDQNSIPPDSNGKPSDCIEDNLPGNSNRKHLSSTSDQSASLVSDAGTCTSTNNKDLVVPFSCEDCGGTFSNKCSLRKHYGKYCMKNIKQEHSEDAPLQSAVHEDEFTAIQPTETQNLTLASEEAEEDFICKGCGSRFALINDLKNHNCGIFECRICKKKYKSKKILMKHSLGVHGQRYECKVCGAKFRWELERSNHMRKHGSKPFACVLCGKRYETKQALSDHIRTEQSNSCTVCNRTFLTRRRLLRHRRRVHVDSHKNLPCPLCDKMFRRKKTLIEHIRTHTEERLLPDSVCKKSFSVKSTPKNHMHLHANGKPERFISEDSRDLHMKRHGKFTQDSHEDEPADENSRAQEHASEDINERTTKEMELDENADSGDLERVEQEERQPENPSDNGREPFSCPDCDKKFTVKVVFIKHLTVHAKKMLRGKKIENVGGGKKHLPVHSEKKSGKKPFVCEVCGTKYKLHCSLRHHMRSHTGDLLKCDICDTKYVSKESLRLHIQNHTGNNPYLCTVCGKRFALQRGLASHSRTHLGEKPFGCELCEKRYSSKFGLVLHMRIHTGEKPYSCTACKQSFRSKKELRSRSMHTGCDMVGLLGPFSCNICGKKFADDCIRKIHLLTHPENNFMCKLCGKGYKRSDYLANHMRAHTNELSEYSKKFNSKSNIQKHRKTRCRERLYSCSVCSKTFAYKNRLRQHTMQVHTVELSECTVCGKKYTSASNLRQHMKIHTSEKKYLCEVCGMRFRAQRDFEKHSITHTGEKPFACTFCEKRYSAKHTLVDHIRTHTGERPYSCTVCNKVFAYKILLGKHAKSVHSGSKSFSCTYCDRKFARKDTLRHHIRTHTGERPFACSLCERRFKASYTLKIHMQVHGADKPFSCTICEKRYLLQFLLNAHMKMHTEYMAYSCSVCGKRFTSKYSRDLHTKRHDKFKFFACGACGLNNFKKKKTLKKHIMDLHVRSK